MSRSNGFLVGVARGAWAAALVLASGACSTTTKPAGGLEVVVETDMVVPTDFDALDVTVSQQTAPGTWATPQGWSFPNLTAASFPTRFSIAAGSSPDQTAKIDVTASLKGAPVVTREVQIAVPTSRVAELVVWLDRECAGVAFVTSSGDGGVLSTCPANETCIPGAGDSAVAAGGCASALVDVTALPDYPAADAGGIVPGADTGVDSTTDSAAEAAVSLEASSLEEGDGSSEATVAPVEASPLDTGAPDATEAAAPIPLGPGAACTGGDQCASTFCADGVCCDKACTGNCVQCDLPNLVGQCSPVAHGQMAASPHTCSQSAASTCGQDGKCDGNGGCEVWANGTMCASGSCDSTGNTSTGVSSCDGLGACKPGPTVPCTPFKCDPSGTKCATACSVPTDCVGAPCVSSSCGTVANGSPCTSGAQCTSTFCVDGYCCNVACAGACQACNQSGHQGTCATAVLGAPQSGRSCAGTGVCQGSCDGTSPACTYPATSVTCASQSCAAGVESLASSCNGTGACGTPGTASCHGYACNGATCFTACTSDAQCLGSTPYCNPGTGTCQATAPQGHACTAGTTSCAAGTYCVSSVCCGSASCPASDQCHAAGTCTAGTGVCTNPTVPDDTGCNDGNPCTSSDVCKAGACAGSAIVCNPTDACHTAGVCSGGVCSNPIGNEGAMCGGGATCHSGTCGVCTPGAVECATASASAVCGGGGTWGTATQCPGGFCNGAGVCGACANGTHQCSNNGIETCANGAWGAPATCNNSACVNGGCTGSCTPGAASCSSGNVPETCNGNGVFQASGPVAAGVCGAVCNPGTTQCSGNGLVTCGPAGTWGTTVSPCGASTPWCESYQSGGVLVGTCTAPLSCSGGLNCGPNGDACCTSESVPGGTFDRGYDGVNSITSPAPGEDGDCCVDNTHPATISPFRLDRYEVTVGRFRNFVNAVVSGWTPQAGSGKHSHLNGGQGLANSNSAGNYESGWQTAWNSDLATTSSGWNNNLNCVSPSGDQSPDQVLATWTPTAMPPENTPINCVEWHEAYAFCIWDGGFLPSQAEWNFAAAGGNEQRQFPWPAATWACAYTNAFGGDCAGVPNPVGSESPTGDGKWLQADLAGNVAELVMDNWISVYPTSCTNCASLPAFQIDDEKLSLGGGFFESTSVEILVSNFHVAATTTRDPNVGFRCARAP